MNGPVKSDAATGTRARTRRAILDAAAHVWSRDRSASLTEVAAAADVGRTTLHRYFPDRAQLVEALVLDTYQGIEQASLDAALDEGSARDAMRRLVTGMIGEGDRIGFLFGELTNADSSPYDFGAEDDDDEFDRRFERLVTRGKASGDFAPELSDPWIVHVVWALIYAGVGAMNEGVLPRHGVAEAVLRCLEGGITPDGSA